MTRDRDGRVSRTTRRTRGVRMFVSSALVAGTLSLLAAGPAIGNTSASFVYERPETRTMPSPLPRVPQAPVMPDVPAGPVVERDSLPPAPSGEPMTPPPPAPVPPTPPEAEDVPFVGERLPVTGMDAILLLGAAALAAGIGLTLRRAGEAERVARTGIFEIPFAVPVPEPAIALEGPVAPAGAVEAADPRPGGRSTAPLLVLGAVAAAGGLGLAALRRRPGRRPSTLREALAAAARPAPRPEPAGALLVAMAVPAIARRIGGPQRRRPRTRPRPVAVRRTA